MDRCSTSTGTSQAKDDIELGVRDLNACVNGAYIQPRKAQNIATVYNKTRGERRWIAALPVSVLAKKSNRARLVRIGRPLKRVSHGHRSCVRWVFVCTGTYGTKEAPDHANGICAVRRTQGNTTALVDLATGCREPDLDGTRDQRRANLKCSVALLEDESSEPTECQYNTQAGLRIRGSMWR